MGAFKRRNKSTEYLQQAMTHATRDHHLLHAHILTLSAAGFGIQVS